MMASTRRIPPTTVMAPTAIGLATAETEPNGSSMISPQPITTAKMDVYWWQDGQGIYAPSACRLKYWDGTNFVLVPDPVGLGVVLNQYNTTMFDAVSSTRFRLEFDSDGTHSTGVLQWKIYDTGATPNFPPTVVGDVDRDVVIGGMTYLSGSVFDDGKLLYHTAGFLERAARSGEVSPSATLPRPTRPPA